MKTIIGVIISICTLLLIYFGMTLYFMDHFYLGSEINSINVSGKTLEEVEKLMASELKGYTLNLREREGKIEQIKGSDLDLKYSSDNEFKNIKERQNPYKWIAACFFTKDSKVTAFVSYDEKLLNEQVDKLSCLDSSNVVEPKNPSFQYVDNGYEILDEVYGNMINKDALYSHIVDSVTKQKSELDLEKANCYINPKYNRKSQKTAENRDTLNKYVSSKIEYTFGDSMEILDGSEINNWLLVNNDFEVVVDDEKVRGYIDELSKTYNTVGKKRNFATSSGSTISIGGGDFGWAINKAAETQNLIAAIKEGQNITKEPEYSKTAFSHDSNDIGNTYVEINLIKQHLWFYKDGLLIAEGDIVTGNVKNNNMTPRGIYSLKYKQRNAVLKGQDYQTPVTFWMPFNRDIGIHDANWRKSFGGEIYKTNGSHGCINAPYKLANIIFNNIKAGTPVVCY